MGQLTARRAIVAAGAAALLASGCKGDAKEAAASSVRYEGPFAEQVRGTIPRIERSTGLRFKSPPKLEARTREQLRAFLEAQFDEERPAREIAAQEAAYKRLGLLPDTLQLRPLFMRLLQEQVAGYYDPKTKTLYVVEGASPDIRDVTISHELVHALQDQYLNLDSLQQIHGDNDRQTAAQAAIEGQAMYEQIAAMVGDANFAARLPGGWDRVREMVRDSRTAYPVLASAPMVVQETLLFPYLSGAEFVKRFKEQKRDGTVLSALPASTEQVMYARAYFDHPDPPTSIALPAPRGAQALYDNALGEFETRLFLFQHLGQLRQADAVRGAAGWDGDRYVLLSTPRGEGIAWLTVWDGPMEAAEFAELLGDVVRRRFGTTPAGSGGARRATAGGRALAITEAEVAGRPAVLFVDVPAGTSTDVMDLAAVRLTEAEPAAR